MIMNNYYKHPEQPLYIGNCTFPIQHKNLAGEKNLVNNSVNYRGLVVGVNTPIPLSKGEYVTAINFDNAATTPPFTSVLQAVNNFSPWYSSIHRGTGYKSVYSSDLYDKSREVIADFVKADLASNTVIYVKNTTEAINKLSNRLYRSSHKNVVLSTEMEHHSNDLPWRSNFDVDYAKVDSNGRLSLKDLEYKLREYEGRVKLVAVTGASNVTGYLNPIHEIAEIAHRYKAKILVDGAQLVPHHDVDMKPDSSPQHIDFLAFSAHKMYAPFGIGVLIGPKKVFERGEPDYRGGGTIELVTHDYVKWAAVPDRDEAGSPNVIGVAALVEAIKTFNNIGMLNIEENERAITSYALNQLKLVPGIKLYGNTEDCSDRLGIITFNLKDMDHRIAATILAQEFGIAVRNGCFCAQPYVQKLLDVSRKDIRKRIKYGDMPHPGLVRISFGIYNTTEEVDILVRALIQISGKSSFYLDKYR
jgi:selenocysteine lyase/cysteine desulfurase